VPMSARIHSRPRGRKHLPPGNFIMDAIVRPSHGRPCSHRSSIRPYAMVRVTTLELGPLWCAVNARFEDYLSSVLVLRYLKGVKFLVCDENHRRQVWWNAISCLYFTDPS
jgi:hypothetical protein